MTAGRRTVDDRPVSEPGWSRFRAAIIASGVVRLVALLIILAGVLGAVGVLRDHNITPHNRRIDAALIAASSVVWASFLAVFAYLIPILVAIYDEARTPRIITPGPPPGPVGRHGPSYGYADPPLPPRGS